MRRWNEVMDLKFSLLIFSQFHGTTTRSQKKNIEHICTTELREQFPRMALVADCDLIKTISAWSISSLPNSTVHTRSWWSRLSSRESNPMALSRSVIGCHRVLSNASFWITSSEWKAEPNSLDKKTEEAPPTCGPSARNWQSDNTIISHLATSGLENVNMASGHRGCAA